MRHIVSVVLLLVMSAVPTFAYDAASQAVIDRLKSGKLVSVSELAGLMMGAERWCYNQRDDECDWSEIYLSADADGAEYELSHAWNEEVDIALIDRGEFRDGRYFCEAGSDWLPSLRAYSRAGGTAIEGRELAALRKAVAELLPTEKSSACFDYLYRGHDAAAQTITLLQRQFTGGVHAPEGDAEVTLHFDKESAENLGWYW